MQSLGLMHSIVPLLEHVLISMSPKSESDQNIHEYGGSVIGQIMGCW